LLIAKFHQPTSHTSNTIDKLNKSKLSGLVNVLHWFCHWYAGGGAAVTSFFGNDNDEFDNGGGGGGGGGPMAAAATTAAAVAAVAVVNDRDCIQWMLWQGHLTAAAALVARFNGGGIGQL
jgi:hypothetical protein